MTAIYRLLPILSLLVLLCGSCSNGPGPLEDQLRGEVQADLNPSGRVPLGALLKFTTKEPCRVSITIPGPTPVTRDFPETQRLHEIPVLGLYPGQANELSITLTTEDGKTYQGTTSLTTEPLPPTFPSIEVTTLQRENMEPGFHLIDLLIGNNGKFLPTPSCSTTRASSGGSWT